MKTKNKTIVLLEIAIVLCSVFLVATLQGIAADQTTQKVSASTVTADSEEYVCGPLDIFGNANEDDTIDMRDTTYIKLVIFGKKAQTDFADANNDAKVSMLDVGQTKLIILGKEKELTVIDSIGKIRTIDRPIESIIPLYNPIAESIKILGAEDKVIGVSDGITKWSEQPLYPKLSKLPNIGDPHTEIDYEKILELNPDLIIGHAREPEGWGTIDEDKLPNIPVVYTTVGYRLSTLVTDIRQLGYILEKENEAEEYINFYEGTLDTIAERVEEVSEEDMPRVYFEGYGDYKTFTNHPRGQIIPMAGGINIAGDLALTTSVDVDAEWVMVQNPDIILRQAPSCGYNVDDSSEIKATRGEIINRPELANINAVKNKRVYMICYPLYIRPKQFVGVAYLAKWFHPELFEDLDPQALHQEYLTRFLRVNYDLDEHGVFVYPEPS